MNKSKSISIAAVLVLIFSITPSYEKQFKISLSKATAADTTTIKTLVKGINSTVNVKDWEITVTKVSYAGRKLEGEYSTYEAAGVWTVLSVTVKNTTGKRQRDDDTPFYFSSSKLVDSQNNKYDVKDTEYKYDIDLLNKPFSPGESRSVDLLFDTPQGINAYQFLLETVDLDPIRINL